MPLENISRKVTLQSGKAEAVLSVVLEDKLIEVIAESANTVIKDDWIGGFAVHRSVQLLAGDRTWLQGDQFTLVDCCYGPLFDALALSRTSLAPYPHIKRYVELVRARPAWKQCAFRA